MIVLDSSFFVAYHNEGDVHHPAAVRVMDRLIAREWDEAILLEYVFLEVVTVLQLRLGPSPAAEVGRRLLGARELRFLPCSDVFLPTWEFFRDEADAGLSFVDAAIAVVAREHAGGLVATFDRGFEGVPGVVTVPG